MTDELLSTYVARQGLPVSNGTRSVLHDTNMHEFLLKFGFRRQYCRLNVVYTPLLYGLVSLAYPFRVPLLRLPRFPLLHNLKALLEQESYRRGCLATASNERSRPVEPGQLFPGSID